MMKFPSFIRVPKYKRFNIEPRYYDPVKEEIEQRTERIRLDLEHEQRAERMQYNPDQTAEQLQQDTGRRIKLERPIERHRKEDFRSAFIQAGIFIFFIGTVFGFLYYGTQVFWALLVFIPIYLFVRFKRLF